MSSPVVTLVSVPPPSQNPIRDVLGGLHTALTSIAWEPHELEAVGLDSDLFDRLTAANTSLRRTAADHGIQV